MEIEKENFDFDRKSIPNFYLADLFYKLQLSNLSTDERNETLKLLLEEIEKNNMYPYYIYVYNELNLTVDQDFYEKLKHRADEELKQIEATILEATENFDSVDTKNTLLLKANFYCKLGDKDNSFKEYELAYNKGIGVEQAKVQMEKGGDWERKNKLKIYESLYYIIIRKFSEASKILIDAASTFTATEILSYDQLIFYVVILSIMTEERSVLNQKILNNSVILQVTSGDDDLHGFVHSFYHCDYKTFLEKTIKIAVRVKMDKYIGRHYRYFLRQTRVRAYQQFLEPFKSVTLKNMGMAFGVSENFIESEVSTFIANGKLNCKIDRVSGSIESNQPNERNTLYLDTIKKGDILLNRIQKLSRVIDM